ncbi:MAG: rhomboid family intramembrane serine protease [Chitinophagaceae bacterium]|nr:rhomboid family intramembrane serine protease [Chitinophagaceae bacterium]
MQIPVTYLIIGFTCLVSIPAFTNEKMINNMVFYPVRMKDGKELYRFFTHGFIHADYMHLIFNMLTLYFFGPYIESILGKPLFLLLYITALVGASLFDYFKHRGNYYYRSLGASGAVSAVLFVTILNNPWAAEICLFGVLCLPNIIFGIAYIAYSTYMDKRGGDNVAHNAHLWGGLYGFAFAAVTRPDLFRDFLNMITHPSF